MISKTINRPLFYNILRQDMPTLITWDMKIDPDSFVFKCCVKGEPVAQMADEFLTIFDDETVSKVQKNINSALTASKHLLMYHKSDLVWFQRSLARMKSVRGAFKSQHCCDEGA